MCLGTVGQITAVGPDRRVQVRAGDRVVTASLLAVSDPLGPGDWVVVHSGLVLGGLTEQEAADALELREPTDRREPTDKREPTDRREPTDEGVR